MRPFDCESLFASQLYLPLPFRRRIHFLVLLHDQSGSAQGAVGFQDGVGDRGQMLDDVLEIAHNVEMDVAGLNRSGHAGLQALDMIGHGLVLAPSARSSRARWVIALVCEGRTF